MHSSVSWSKIDLVVYICWRKHAEGKAALQSGTLCIMQNKSVTVVRRLILVLCIALAILTPVPHLLCLFKKYLGPPYEIFINPNKYCLQMVLRGTLVALINFYFPRRKWGTAAVSLTQDLLESLNKRKPKNPDSPLLQASLPSLLIFCLPL